MKKNTFIEGTIIATLAVVLVKILGMIYVIPFYAIVGTQGAALYAYAYNVYSLFLEISTAGIPNAVSKLINEFNTLNRQEAKIRTFLIGKRLLSFIAIIAFIILFCFAPQIASLIIGDLAGGNTIEDVAFVIRCVSFALLSFPFLSVTRGFFQGHNVIAVSSISQVIEQIARVLVIVLGSYVAIHLLGFTTTHAVGVAVFGAFAGALCAFLYVHRKLKKHKKEFNLDTKFKELDKVTNKEIILKIIKYAVPIVVVSVAFTIYNNVDMIMILRVMNNLGYKAFDVEFIASAMSTWAPKISLIVTSISMGLSFSLVPSMVESYTLKDYKDVNNKFNKAMEIMIFISLPMCIGISFLSSAIWTVFYGYNAMGANILAISIFAPLFSNLFTISNYTLQSMNKFKMVYISAITGIFINIILDMPFMYLCNFIGLPAYFGATMATIVGMSVAVIITMLILKKEHNFHYCELFKVILKTFIPLIVMIIVVVLLKNLLFINYSSRLSCVIFISVIVIVAALIYFFISYKIGLINKVLGDDFINKLKKRFFKKKKEAN